MDILTMEPDDIALLDELQPEGWGSIAEHFLYNILSPLCDPVKVVMDGKMVGVGNSIQNEDTAWLSQIIVTPAYRGRGIGTQITQALVDRLDKNRFQTILLDATEFGCPVYRKVGFEVISQHVHLAGETSAGIDLPSCIVPFNEQYTDEILALDKLATGEGRAAFLMEHIQEAFVYTANGKAEGVYFPSAGRGTIVATTKEAGIELMKLRLKKQGTCMLPEENVAAKEFLLNMGFKQTRVSKRMRLGKPRDWHGDMIYNTISGARG